jgi:hypothetical protein
MKKNILPLVVNTSRPHVDLFDLNFRDSYIHNMYCEVYKDDQTKTQRVFAVKRPGMNNIPTSAPGGGSGVGLGCFTSQNLTATNIYYGVGYGSNLYIYHFNDSITTLLYSGVNSSTMYPQIKFSNVGLPDDTINTAIVNGEFILYFKAGAFITSESPGSGAPWSSGTQLTHAVYLNNRIFIGNMNNGQIFQSDLGNFQNFPASEFLTVESYGGKLVDLARYNNYIAAFKEYSTEFFEDVANDIGTVLSRVDQAVQQVGCVNPATIVDTGGGELMWVSNDESGRKHVAKLNNSFQVQFIEDQHLAKHLELVTAYDGSYAFICNVNGRQFYVLSLAAAYYPTAATDINNVTFVYDMESGMWYNWYSDGTGTLPSFGGFNYRTLGRWLVAGSCKSKFATTYVQRLDTGSLYQLDDAYGVDVNSVITAKIRISGIDCDTFDRKFLNSVTVLTDQYTYATYQFSVGWYTQDGATGYARTITSYYLAPYEATGWAFGSFKRGSLEITNTQNVKLRISGIIMDYDVGDARAVS